MGMSVWGTSQASGAPLGRKTLWGALGAGFCGPSSFLAFLASCHWLQQLDGTWTLQSVPV